MAQQNINTAVGGDTIKQGFDKTQANTTELYGRPSTAVEFVNLINAATGLAFDSEVLINAPSGSGGGGGGISFDAEGYMVVTGGSGTGISFDAEGYLVVV